MTTRAFRCTSAFRADRLRKQRLLPRRLACTSNVRAQPCSPQCRGTAGVLTVAAAVIAFVTASQPRSRRRLNDGCQRPRPCWITRQPDLCDGAQRALHDPRAERPAARDSAFKRSPQKHQHRVTGRRRFKPRRPLTRHRPRPGPFAVRMRAVGCPGSSACMALTIGKQALAQRQDVCTCSRAVPAQVASVWMMVWARVSAGAVLCGAGGPRKGI